MNKDLENLLLHYEGSLYDLCYKILEESEDLENDFDYICRNLTKVLREKTAHTYKYINEDEHALLRKIYEEKIDGILSEVINKTNYGLIDLNDFYKTLLGSLKENFTSQKELTIALEKIFNDKRIPFVYLGEPLTMSQSVYKDKVTKNMDSIKKLIYALHTDYSQKTEIASILLNIIEDSEDYEDRVVVFSQLISIIQRTTIVNTLKKSILEDTESPEQ